MWLLCEYQNQICVILQLFCWLQFWIARLKYSSLKPLTEKIIMVFKSTMWFYQSVKQICLLQCWFSVYYHNCKCDKHDIKKWVRKKVVSYFLILHNKSYGEYMNEIGYFWYKTTLQMFYGNCKMSYLQHIKHKKAEL